MQYDHSSSSYSPRRTYPQSISWANPVSPTHSGGGIPRVAQHSSPQQQPRRIQVKSTIDADIVLRRVIEDRAAILALKSRAAENEAELMKAKTRQLQITKILDRQDIDIATLTTKAKRELKDYNEQSKQYIRSFMIAFEHGEIDRLPHHPFLPSLNELGLAIDRRKATLIEKVQADDRVKKLELVNSQERVTMSVLKKNEQAFLSAIDIAKQQFSDSCGKWLDNVDSLLAPMPHHAQKFDDVKNAMNAHRSQQPAQTVANDALPHLPLYNRRVLTQEEVVSPRTSPAKRPAMESVGPGRPSNTSGDASTDGETTASIVSPANKNKRQKTELAMLASPPTMPDLGIKEDRGAKHDDSDSRVIDLTPTESNDAQQDSSVCESCVNEEIEMAQVLSSMNKSTSAQFAVPNI